MVEIFKDGLKSCVKDDAQSDRHIQKHSIKYCRKMKRTTWKA